MWDEITYLFPNFNRAKNSKYYISWDILIMGYSNQVKSSQRFLLQQNKYHTYINIRDWNPFGFICLLKYIHYSYRAWPHFGDNRVSTGASTEAKWSPKGTRAKNSHECYYSWDILFMGYPNELKIAMNKICHGKLSSCDILITWK